MSIDKLLKSLDKLERGLPRVTEIAARTAMAEMGRRIFTRGLNSAGRKIGEYSTKPIYISKSKTPSGSGGYFAGGYKEFKQSIGRGSKVNFRLFNQLQNDFAGGNIKAPRPTKESRFSYIVRLKDEFNEKKRKGLEERFTITFDPSKSERIRFRKAFEFELRRILP